jgi:hypothetical protein
MPHLFVATYLVNRQLREPDFAGAVAKAFFTERSKTGPDAFPYDGADDPAFFCAKHLESAVTWGVCRTDVRNQVAPGDWVALFSGERLDSGDGQDIDYRFVAVQRVSVKLDPLDLPWPYNQYLNRLAERRGHNLRHVEPALDPRSWHRDWLWRVSSHPGQPKEVLERLGAAIDVDEGALRAVRNRVRNYVVFDRTQGFILERPPVVATKRGVEQMQEQWLETHEVQTLRAAVFGTESERWLRTTNRQQPHRHTRRELANEGVWFESVRAAAGALM